MRRGAALWILTAGFACLGGPSNTSFDYSRNVGLAVGKKGHVCLYVRNSTALAGQSVTLVMAGKPPGTVAAQIIRKGDEICRDSTLDEPGVTHYSIRVTRDAQLAGPAFAVIGFGGPWKLEQDEATADLDGDGQREHFRSCTSSEGLHLTIWKGKPPESERTWHRYFYLGYDVDSDCTDAEMRPDRQ